MPRVAKQRSNVNPKALITKAGKPPNVVRKRTYRLSGLAHAIAIYAQMGVTSTAILAKLTRYTKRAVIDAKKELLLPENRQQMGEVGFIHLVNRGSPSVPHVVNQGSHSEASADPLSPLKKKSLPHTPSKEKTTPFSPRLESEESLSQTTTLSAAAKIDSSLPAIIQVGAVKLSVAAIDGTASLAGLEKNRARTLARAMAEDWVARSDVPNYPMSVIRRAFAQQAREDFAQRRDVPEWGAGRG